jgi:hypothetical protein
MSTTPADDDRDMISFEVLVGERGVVEGERILRELGFSQVRCIRGEKALSVTGPKRLFNQVFVQAASDERAEAQPRIRVPPQLSSYINRIILPVPSNYF